MATKKKSIVDRARELHPSGKKSKKLTEEEMELVVARLRGELTIAQVAAAKNELEGKEATKTFGTSGYIFLCRGYEQFIHENLDISEL